MLHINPTQRFSSRVGNYARCRPSYPPEIIDILRQECGLTPDSVIADVASGTGIFTRLLLENGNRVYGMEPNEAMRKAGEEYLAGYPKFTSVRGTAEDTTLPDTSVDLVTAAQAAHWFERRKALEEFRRILKPAGYLVLVWNDRRKNAAAFDHEYEQLLENFGTDYEEVKRRDNASMQFFGPIPHQLRILRNFQDFDYESLEGRLLSSSYTPQPGHPSHDPMLAKLRRIFEAHQKSGTVRMEYDTKLYFGQLVPAERLENLLMPPKVGSKPSFHMDPEEFRKRGHEVVDWIAEYYKRIESFPVLSQVKPGDVRSSLPTEAPQQGEPFERILQDVDKLILPGVTHWQSPNFFAFFPSNASGPSILGDLLSSGLGVQGMLWATSPACTELETLILDWLARALALPEKFLSTSKGGGVIQDTASSATLCALLAARERATNFESNRAGVQQKLRAYTSTQAHSATEKAIGITGVGRDFLRLIEVDETFAMNPAVLARAMQQDRESGRIPFFVCATSGSTSSNAIDPLRKIGPICREFGAWLHVDSAMSGTAALCPEFRHINDGIEYADSYCFNPHKWMFTNFDCDCFYVADREALVRALSILPEYLRNKATESGAVTDYRDWQIPLGRRFRSLKLWFVLRYYGIEGLQFHIREHVRLSQEFAKWVSHDDRFELAAPVPLNLVCFRLKSGDDANQHLMDSLNRSGDLYLTHTKLSGRLTLRFCVGQTNTEERHVQKAWRRIKEEASRPG